jgi:hypothetical protein
MDIEKLRKGLVDAARANAPGDTVPPTFEKRIVARLRDLTPEDPLLVWSRALWYAAAPCLIITLLLGAWSFTRENPPAPDTDLSQQLEHAVLAEVAQDQTLDLTW